MTAKCRVHAPLESLPGVGRKTANVVLNMWWRYPAQAVDTHIFRFGNRSGVCRGRMWSRWNAPLEMLYRWFQRYAHHWMILHGRYTCVGAQTQMQRLPDPRPVQFEDKTP
ncbi:MAG: hypothetical protein R3D81_00795 [Thalassovita sp.]